MALAGAGPATKVVGRSTGKKGAAARESSGSHTQRPFPALKLQRRRRVVAAPLLSPLPANYK